MKPYYAGVIKLANRWETSKSKKQIFKHDNKQNNKPETKKEP